MITRELENNITLARTDARRRRLDVVTVEHLTYILICENTTAREMLVDFRADIAGLKKRLEEYLSTRVPGIQAPGEPPKTSAGVHRVLQRAQTQAEKGGQEADGVHVLAAVFAEPESYAAYFMQKYGVERLSLVNWMSAHGPAGTPAPHIQEFTKRKKTKDTTADLVVQAQDGLLEEAFGREAEVSTLIRILSHKYKNNPLLVGEAGVGKTSIVHALAHRIASGNTPPTFVGMKLVPLSITELIADTKYRGDFEQRIRQLVERCKEHGKTVLFIDEIHTIIGAGAVSGAVLDAANALKPLLGGEVRIIGATTFAEYRRYIDRDSALARRFQKVEVREPDDIALKTILDGVIQRLSTHHGVCYARGAAHAAVELSRRYLPNRHLPDKAIDLLDSAGAARWQAEEAASVSAESTAAPAESPLGEKELLAAALRAAGLPQGADKPRLAELEDKLSATVLSQPEASHVLSRAVMRAQLGFQEDGRTQAAFLFVGPTGVGKTEMAKQLALILGLPLLRYDMSEYMERHAVSRLIGAPPGYIGFEQGGKLVEDVFRHPNAVVLFDEAEKAHPEVLNILLQVLDYGVLTDNSGRRADFSNTMVILTSNIGSAEMSRGASGFARNDEAEKSALGDESLNRFFSPEFRNRLDAIIRFQSLSPETMSNIIDMRLSALLVRLSDKCAAHFSVSAALRTALRHEGSTSLFGARQLERLLRERITEPLALATVSGEIFAGGRFRLDINPEGGITIHAQKPRKSRAKQPITAEA